jgi:hypothetical protein
MMAIVFSSCGGPGHDCVGSLEKLNCEIFKYKLPGKDIALADSH